jgi:hypothetical protein
MTVNKSRVKGNKGIKEDVYGSEVSLASSEKS